MFIFGLIILFLSPTSSKPWFNDLDDERQILRAAFDTHTYDIDDNDDMELGKIDLLKDGMWVVKAKLKELKAFNKALAANILLTNMKLRELLENQLEIKKHQHNINDKKFFHNYQPQPYLHEPRI